MGTHFGAICQVIGEWNLQDPMGDQIDISRRIRITRTVKRMDQDHPDRIKEKEAAVILGLKGRLDDFCNDVRDEQPDCPFVIANTIVVTGHPVDQIVHHAEEMDTDLIIMGSHTRQEDIGATRYRSVVGSTMQKVAKSARCPVVIVSRPCTTCWKLFSNIVFGTDFSKAADSAFMFASKLANEVGAKLHMFHACDISSTSAGQVLGQEEIEQLIENARNKMKTRYAAKMNGYDNYDVEVREGVPYIEILKFAREKMGDLIVMAHHTREVDPEEAVLGGTVEQVVLRSACPVASVNHPDKVS